MTIHISNLSLNIIEGDLHKLFSAYGEVVFLRIIRDRGNGRSNENAFVEMPLQAHGEQAINALDKMEIDGQKISVKKIEYKPGEFNN